MTSKAMRENPLFLRNNYPTVGKWDISLVKKQALPIDNVKLIACSDTRANDKAENKKNGVHFFVDDYRFENTYDRPKQPLARYSQYAFLLTPDFSLYGEFQLWRQLENVGKSRWVGAYWQDHGLTVIPTISWSTSRSYDFCFDGVEQNATVAVGMIGCKSTKMNFLRGYSAMLERLQPEKIIVFGKPFSEMQGNIISVDYRESRRVVR